MRFRRCLKPRPAAAHVQWLYTRPRADQFTSAVVMGELFSGAFRSADAARHLGNIEQRPDLALQPVLARARRGPS